MSVLHLSLRRKGRHVSDPAFAQAQEHEREFDLDIKDRVERLERIAEWWKTGLRKQGLEPDSDEDSSEKGESA